MSDPRTRQFNRILIAEPSKLINLLTKNYVYICYKTENKQYKHVLIIIDHSDFETFRTNVLNIDYYEFTILELLLQNDIKPHYKLEAQLQVSPEFYG